MLVRNGVIMGVCDFIELTEEEKAVKTMTFVSAPSAMRLAQEQHYPQQITSTISSTKWRLPDRLSVARERMTSVLKPRWKTVRSRVISKPLLNRSIPHLNF